MNRLKSTFIVFLLICSTHNLFAAGVDRYAIYIGSNNGGKEREQLLYASSDAESFKKVMAEVGGIEEANAYLLVDPTKKDINNAMEEISEKIERNRTKSNRSEFIFYYSGHSDEEALLLGENRYDYSSLKQTITDVPSDIHVVILDSCYSGNFIRTKGGQKKKPFLMDDSTVVKGHAYLSSSSETESSQESDEIEASYFTSSVITGLRGAADTSGDQKVSLNELYSYAFSETLKKTEDTNAGPQHPNYNITLVGSGDLILSDFSQSDSVVSIAKDIKGKVLLRDSTGKLVSEINKSDDVPIMLALPKGRYSVVIIGDRDTYQGNFELRRDEGVQIDSGSVKKIDTKKATVRGNKIVQEVKEESGSQDFTIVKYGDPNCSKLPFDYLLSLSMSSFYDDAFGEWANVWYVQDNMVSPHIDPFVFSEVFGFGRNKDVSLLLGCSEILALFDDGKNDSTCLYLCPQFGLTFHWNSCLPLEGLGMVIYPFYNIPINPPGLDACPKSYWDYQTALEFRITGLVWKNFSIGGYERLVLHVKDERIAPSFDFGLTIGMYRPGQKNFDALQDRAHPKFTRSRKHSKRSVNYTQERF